MIIELSKIELDVTREIISIGLSKAADSLSSFIKEKVLIQHFELKINSSPYNPLSTKKYNNKSYLLTTDIRGEIQGKAYLIFNESEVNKLASINLTEAFLSNSIEREKMTNAILLEIDNIITASVVTQLSNILKFKLYGDVPKLDILSANELNPFLNAENHEQCNILYFNTRFISHSMDINPEFIWLINDRFFQGVKKVVNDEKMIEILRKVNIHE